MASRGGEARRARRARARARRGRVHAVNLGARQQTACNPVKRSGRRAARATLQARGSAGERASGGLISSSPRPQLVHSCRGPRSPYQRSSSHHGPLSRRLEPGRPGQPRPRAGRPLATPRGRVQEPVHARYRAPRPRGPAVGRSESHAFLSPCPRSSPPSPPRRADLSAHSCAQASFLMNSESHRRSSHTAASSTGRQARGGRALGTRSARASAPRRAASGSALSAGRTGSPSSAAKP